MPVFPLESERFRGLSPGNSLNFSVEASSVSFEASFTPFEASDEGFKASSVSFEASYAIFKLRLEDLKLEKGRFGVKNEVSP
jgi:hypothetical protein